MKMLYLDIARKEIVGMYVGKQRQSILICSSLQYTTRDLQENTKGLVQTRDIYLLV